MKAVKAFIFFMQELTKSFTQLAYRFSYSEALNIVLDSILFPVCIQSHEDFQIKNPVDRYKLNDDEINTLRQVLVAVGNIAEKGEDPFGDLFMEFISHGRNGQFFTPMEICRFMAEIAFVNPEGEPEEKISDPACGSGRMFLAAAAAKGKTIHFYGTDIDDTCCKMATANMILHNLVADISCGDELTMRFSHVYMIRRSTFSGFPTLRILKYVKEETRAAAVPDMVLSMPETKQERYVQGTLF